MIIKLRDLFNAKEAFARLIEEPLQIGTAQILRAFTQDLNVHFGQLEEGRNKLINDIGTEKDDGQYEFSKENQEEFMTKFDALLDEEIDLDWAKISINELENSLISVKDLNTLSFLFIELSVEKEQVVEPVVV
jgi:hypothetical protein